jgi:hypothetical protein
MILTCFLERAGGCAEADGGVKCWPRWLWVSDDPFPSEFCEVLESRFQGALSSEKGKDQTARME